MMIVTKIIFNASRYIDMLRPQFLFIYKISFLVKLQQRLRQ